MRHFIALLFGCGFLLNCCCDKDFITPGDYDFFAYAVDMTDSIDTGCSYLPFYTTENATQDGPVGNCLDNPVQNRWFKFLSPYTGIYIDMRTGSTEGTQINSVVTLWDADGTTELTCETYSLPDDDIFMSYGGLIVGEWYYISVDVDLPAHAGTFDLCLYTD